MSEGAARSLRVAMIGYLVTAIADGTDPHPSFARAFRCSGCLQRSGERSERVRVGARGGTRPLRL